MDKRNNQNPYLVNLLDYYKSRLGVAIEDDDAANAIASYLHITKARFFSKNFPNPKEDKHKVGTIQAPFSWETMKLLTLGFNFPLNYFILTERDLDAFLASKILGHTRKKPSSRVRKNAGLTNTIHFSGESKLEMTYNRLEQIIVSLANKKKSAGSDIDGNAAISNVISQDGEVQNVITIDSIEQDAGSLSSKTFITEEDYNKIFSDLLRFHNTHRAMESEDDQGNVPQLSIIINKAAFKKLYSELDKKCCLLRDVDEIKNRMFTKHSPINRLQFHLIDDFDKETFVERYEKIMVEFVAKAVKGISVYSYLGKGSYKEPKNEIPLYVEAHRKVFKAVENILANSENPKIDYTRFLALPNDERIWSIDEFEEIVKKIGQKIEKLSMGNMSGVFNAIIECSIPEFMHICNIILNEKNKGEVHIVYKPTFIHHYAVIDSKYALTEIYRYKSNRAFVPELLFLINTENEKEALRGLVKSYEKDIDKLFQSHRSLLISRKTLTPLISSAYKALREYIDMQNDSKSTNNTFSIDIEAKVGRLNRKMNDMKEKLKEFNERYQNKLDLDIVNEL